MHSTKITILLVFFSFSIIVFGSNDYPVDLSKAESQYERGEYNSFLEVIKNALVKYPMLKDDIILNAKIAYSLYHLKRYDEAEIIWDKVLEDSEILCDYFGWYRGLNALAAGDTLRALDNWNDAMDENPSSTLLPKIQFFSSEICAAVGDYDRALHWMLTLYNSGHTAGHNEAFILSQLIKYSNYLKKDSLEYLYLDKLLIQYPYDENSYLWYSNLHLAQDLSRVNPSRIKLYLDILLDNKKYNEALDLIDKAGKIKSIKLDNTFKYYRGKIYFSQKKYHSAYKVYNSLPLQQFNLSTRRMIMRQKGRCLYRTGRKKSAYNEFLKLANKFPQWSKSLELLWVAAWNYDVKKQYKNAAYWYNKIIKLNPNSEYAWKSRFRLGFNSYLQGKYSEAIKAFDRIAKSKIWYLWKDQAKYWQAKSFESMQKFDRALINYGELAERPVANYYALESYLLLKALDPDSMWLDQSNFTPENRFFALDVEFDAYVHEFKRVLTIEQVFGNDMASEELQTSKIPKDREMSYYVALVRLYRKIGEYGQAYRLQLKIINQYFNNLPLTFQSPTIKYLFPLFYDDYVFAMSNESGVEPEIVFAVMRQESAFQEDAESRAGAFGLLQLMPGTAKNLHVRYIDEPWDIGRLIEPDYNIQLGLYYLSGLISKYDDNYFHVFVAYNAGPSRLKKWKKTILRADKDIFVESVRFDETRTYVRNCMRNYWVYKIILGSSPLIFYDYLKDGHPLLGEK